MMRRHAALALVLGKRFYHGWAEELDPSQIKKLLGARNVKKLGEGIDALAEEYDEEVEGLYPSTSYDVIDDVLVHRTRTDSLIFAWRELEQLVLHLSPTTGRLRWVAGAQDQEAFVVTAEDYYTGKAPAWAYHLVGELVEELGLPSHLDIEKARAAALLLGGEPEQMFGEEILPTHVAGLRAVALEWATATTYLDVGRLLNGAGFEEASSEFVQGEFGPGQELTAALARRAVDNFVHQHKAFEQAFEAAHTDPESHKRLVNMLPEELRQLVAADE